MPTPDINAVGGPAPYNPNPGMITGPGNQPQRQYAGQGWASGQDAIPFLEQYMQGRDPNGRAGMNIENAFAGMNTGQGMDMRLGQYGLRQENAHAEGGGNWALGNDTVGSTGRITRDGKEYAQAGEFLDKIIDPTKAFYDEEFGLLTDVSNIHNPERALDKWMPAIVAAGMGGITAAHALGAGAASGAGSSVGSGSWLGAGPLTAMNAGGMTGAGEGWMGMTGLDALNAGAGNVAAGAGGGSSWMDQIKDAYDNFKNPFSQGTGGEGVNYNGNPVDALNSGGGNVFNGTGSGGWMDVARKMPWSDLIKGAGNIFGRSQEGDMNEAAERERVYNEVMWTSALQANRPNQNTAFGSSSWKQDPTTGAWTQDVTLNPQDQQRLDQFRNIASGRMNDAGKLLQMDWSKINPNVGKMMQGVSFGGNQLRGG